MTLKIYNKYTKYGVANYYKQFAEEYYNPHADKIIDLYLKYLSEYINSVLNNDKIILDIACGNGLITKIILKNYNQNNNLNITNKNKLKKQIKGCDPYFNNKYVNYNYSFEDIAMGLVNNLKVSVGICCYAFHLLEPSWYYNFFLELSEIVEERIIIITPSKKIVVNHPLWIIEKEIRDDKITLIILKNIRNY